MRDFRPSFEAGLPMPEFLAHRGNPGDKRHWESVAAQVVLTAEQQRLLASFRRRMNVLCMASSWCGDCAQQGPILYRISLASTVIDLRFRDRDDDPELANELQICGSPRIPQIVFLDEDSNHVGRYGDRTLANYRQLVSDLGEPTGLQSDDGRPDGIAPMVQDWMDEFERIQWLLRSSPRLRARYRD